MKTKIANNATGITMPLQQLCFNTIRLLLATVLLFNLYIQKAFSQPLKSTTISSNTISGKAMDKNDTPLKNVTIQFDGKNIATTDDKGLFSFTIENTSKEMHQIIFLKEGYINIVRNYNANMNNANYNIKMYEPCKCDSLGECFSNSIAFDFENDDNKLNEKQKAELNNLIKCLKLNPENEITIRYNTLFPKKQISTQRLETVVKYFISNGIMEYRVKKETVTNKGSNTRQIEILNN
jgi:outer membrane protein OmpA-like peptidoglycan-associated protein